MPSIFYLDPLNGLDATTATPLGWWSLAITAGTGGAPVAGEACSGATAHGHLTVYVHASGSWAGNDEAGTLYFYGKTGTFVAETVSWAAGSGTVAGDAVYCAWKTFGLGATGARVAAGDTVRVAKSAAPISLGNAAWTDRSKTVTLAANTATQNVYMCETTAFTPKTGLITVLNATPTAGGSGYAINDTFNITTGGTLATGKVTAVSGSVVTGVILTASGSGYTTGAGKATVHTSGGGNDALTVNITTVANVTASYQTATKKEGAGSCLITPPATFQNTLLAYYPIGSSLDLSAFQSLSFWFRSGNGNIAVNTYKICLCSDTAGATIVDSFLMPASTATNIWHPLNLTKDGGGNLGAAIQSIAVYSDTVKPTSGVFGSLDDIIATKTGDLSLLSLISKNSLEQGGTEPWLAIQSINGTTILLDNGTQTEANAGRGYSGATDAAVTTYRRETGYGNSIQGWNGTIADHDINYIGGYDPVTNLCDGETFLDGWANSATGIIATNINVIHISHFSLTRWNIGISLEGTTNGSVIENVQSANNNGSVAYRTVNTANGNSFSATNVCNNVTNGVSANKRNATVIIENCNSNIGVGIGHVGEYSTIGPFTNINNNGSHGLQLGDATTIADSSVVSNIRVNAIAHCDYNGGNGIYITQVVDFIIEGLVADHNTGTAVWADNQSRGTVNNITTSNNSAGSYSVRPSPFSTLYIRNLTYSETYIKDAAEQGSVYVSGVNGDLNDNRYLRWYASWQSVTTTRPGGTGIMWTMTPGTTGDVDAPLEMPLARIAVKAGTLVTVKCWVKKSAVIPNVSGQMLCRWNQIAWADASTDKTAVAPDDTNWNELSLSFTPTEAGVVEIVAQGWFGSGNITFEDMTITNMTLPTKEDLVTLDYVYRGKPFVDAPAKNTIDLTTLDYIYQGQPFVSNPAAASAPAGMGQVI